MATGVHFRLEQLTVACFSQTRQWDNGTCSEGVNFAPQKYFIQYIQVIKTYGGRRGDTISNIHVESENVLVMLCNLIILFCH